MLPALAFCNDADFADWRVYREVHRILGEEFGFPAQDSFWLFDPAGSEMALFRGSVDEKGPRHDELLEEMKVGRLAVLHSAGNFSRSNTVVRPSRGLVEEGLAYVRERGRMPTVWTNHGDQGDIQNIGGNRPTYQEGDDPASGAYILDLLLQGGIQYFWTDNHASNEFVFSANGTSGPPLLVKERTRAGFEITCFHRYRGALPKAPDAQSLGLQLTQDNLDRLVQKGGVTVIYQHWCVHRDAEGRPYGATSPVFSRDSMTALKRLADYRDRARVRVLPLTELLQECADRKE
jgi:hypothetical protein